MGFMEGVFSSSLSLLTCHARSVFKQVSRQTLGALKMNAVRRSARLVNWRRCKNERTPERSVSDRREHPGKNVPGPRCRNRTPARAALCRGVSSHRAGPGTGGIRLAKRGAAVAKAEQVSPSLPIPGVNTGTNRTRWLQKQNEPGNARLKATKWDLEGFDGQQEVNKQWDLWKGFSRRP